MKREKASISSKINGSKEASIENTRPKKSRNPAQTSLTKSLQLKQTLSSAHANSGAYSHRARQPSVNMTVSSASQKNQKLNESQSKKLNQQLNSANKMSLGEQQQRQAPTFKSSVIASMPHYNHHTTKKLAQSDLKLDLNKNVNAAFSVDISIEEGIESLGYSDISQQSRHRRRKPPSRHSRNRLGKHSKLSKTTADEIVLFEAEFLADPDSEPKEVDMVNFTGFQAVCPLQFIDLESFNVRRLGHKFLEYRGHTRDVLAELHGKDRQQSIQEEDTMKLSSVHMVSDLPMFDPHMESSISTEKGAAEQQIAVPKSRPDRNSQPAVLSSKTMNAAYNELVINELPLVEETDEERSQKRAVSLQISERDLAAEAGRVQSAESTISRKSHVSIVSKKSRISEVTRSIQLEENPFIEKQAQDPEPKQEDSISIHQKPSIDKLDLQVDLQQDRSISIEQKPSIQKQEQELHAGYEASLSVELKPSIDKQKEEPELRREDSLPVKGSQHIGKQQDEEDPKEDAKEELVVNAKELRGLSHEDTGVDNTENMQTINAYYQGLDSCGSKEAPNTDNLRTPFESRDRNNYKLVVDDKTLDSEIVNIQTHMDESHIVVHDEPMLTHRSKRKLPYSDHQSPHYQQDGSADNAETIGDGLLQQQNLQSQMRDTTHTISGDLTGQQHQLAENRAAVTDVTQTLQQRSLQAGAFDVCQILERSESNASSYQYQRAEFSYKESQGSTSNQNTLEKTDDGQNDVIRVDRGQAEQESDLTIQKYSEGTLQSQPNIRNEVIEEEVEKESQISRADPTPKMKNKKATNLSSRGMTQISRKQQPGYSSLSQRSRMLIMPNFDIDDDITQVSRQNINRYGNKVLGNLRRARDLSSSKSRSPLGKGSRSRERLQVVQTTHYAEQAPEFVNERTIASRGKSRSKERRQNVHTQRTNQRVKSSKRRKQAAVTKKEQQRPAKFADRQESAFSRETEKGSTLNQTSLPYLPNSKRYISSARDIQTIQEKENESQASPEKVNREAPVAGVGSQASKSLKKSQQMDQEQINLAKKSSKSFSNLQQSVGPKNNKKHVSSLNEIDYKKIREQMDQIIDITDQGKSAASPDETRPSEFKPRSDFSQIHNASQQQPQINLPLLNSQDMFSKQPYKPLSREQEARGKKLPRSRERITEIVGESSSVFKQSSAFDSRKKSVKQSFKKESTRFPTTKAQRRAANYMDQINEIHRNVYAASIEDMDFRKSIQLSNTFQDITVTHKRQINKNLRDLRGSNERNMQGVPLHSEIAQEALSGRLNGNNTTMQKDILAQYSPKTMKAQHRDSPPTDVQKMNIHSSMEFDHNMLNIQFGDSYLKKKMMKRSKYANQTENQMANPPMITSIWDDPKRNKKRMALGYDSREGSGDRPQYSVAHQNTYGSMAQHQQQLAELSKQARAPQQSKNGISSSMTVSPSQAYNNDMNNSGPRNLGAFARATSQQRQATIVEEQYNSRSTNRSKSSKRGKKQKFVKLPGANRMSLKPPNSGTEMKMLNGLNTSHNSQDFNMPNLVTSPEYISGTRNHQMRNLNNKKQQPLLSTSVLPTTFNSSQQNLSTQIQLNSSPELPLDLYQLPNRNMRFNERKRTNHQIKNYKQAAVATKDGAGGMRVGVNNTYLKMDARGMKVIRVADSPSNGSGGLGQTKRSNQINQKAIEQKMSRAITVEKDRGQIAQRTGRGIVVGMGEINNSKALTNNAYKNKYTQKLFSPEIQNKSRASAQPARKSTTVTKERPSDQVLKKGLTANIQDIYKINDIIASQQMDMKFRHSQDQQKQYQDQLNYVSPQNPQNAGAPPSGAATAHEFYRSKQLEEQKQQYQWIANQSNQMAAGKFKSSMAPNISAKNLQQNHNIQNMRLINNALNKQDKQIDQKFKQKRHQQKMMTQLEALSSTQNRMIQRDLSVDRSRDQDDLVRVMESKINHLDTTANLTQQSAMEYLVNEPKLQKAGTKKSGKFKRSNSPYGGGGGLQNSKSFLNPDGTLSSEDVLLSQNLSHYFDPVQVTYASRNQIPVNIRREPQQAERFQPNQQLYMKKAGQILKAEATKSGPRNRQSQHSPNKKNLKIASLLSLERNEQKMTSLQNDYKDKDSRQQAQQQSFFNYTQEMAPPRTAKNMVKDYEHSTGQVQSSYPNGQYQHMIKPFQFRPSVISNQTEGVDQQRAEPLSSSYLPNTNMGTTQPSFNETAPPTAGIQVGSKGIRGHGMILHKNDDELDIHMGSQDDSMSPFMAMNDQTRDSLQR